MTTWVDVVTIGSHEPCTRVVELLHTGHSRFPVIDPDASNYVVGIVAVTDLLAIPSEQRVSVLVGAVAKPPLVVPAGKRLRGVLDDLRTQHRQIACVIDEFGLFVGVITLEDIAEELVGPIRDEDDPVDPAPRQLPDGSWLVPARWRIDEIADETGIRLRKPDHYDTLSGLLLAQLGRAPDVDEEVALPIEVPDGSGVRTVLSRVVSVHRRVANEVLLFAPESDVT